MVNFIIRRLLGMIPTLVLVSILTFVIISLPAGDYATALAAQAAASGGTGDEAFIQTIRHQYGLDQPLYLRYVTWIVGCVHGDFGYSFEWKQPVADLIASRIAFTLLLSLLALAFSWVVAIPIGIYSATHQYSPADVGLTTVGFLGLSIPDFMLGLVYLFIATVVFGASASGLISADLEQAPWTLTKAWDFVGHLFWAVLIIGVAGTAQLMRIMRGNLLETLGQQFVTTARAKGLTERIVVNRYAVRVAINPLISVLGMQLPNLISGATIVGVVLSLPTTGPLFLHALQNQDTYLAGTFLLMLALMLLLGNLLADILLAWADPRIRYD
jgi:peptide/nickel transport system permease protein